MSVELRSGGASAAFRTMFDLTRRTQFRAGRVAVLGVFAVLGIVLAAVTGAASARESAVIDAADVPGAVVAGYGLRLFVPVVALVLASAAFGDMREDRTLVYVWATPVPRWALVAGALTAVTGGAVLLSALPTTVMAAVIRAGTEPVVAGLVSSVAAILAYCAIFCWLGLITHRSLLIGLLYVFVWEGAITSIAQPLGVTTVRHYAETVFLRLAGTGVGPDAPSTAVSLIVLGVFTLVFAWLASFRLSQLDVS